MWPPQLVWLPHPCCLRQRDRSALTRSGGCFLNSEETTRKDSVVLRGLKVLVSPYVFDVICFCLIVKSNYLISVFAYLLWHRLVVDCGIL